MQKSPKFYFPWYRVSVLSAVFTINPHPMVTDCHGGMYSGDSEVWLKSFLIAVHTCDPITSSEQKADYLHSRYICICMCTPTHAAHVHVCMANSGVGIHAHMQTSRLMQCKVNTCITYVLHENENIQFFFFLNIITCWHIHPPIYESPHNSVIGFPLIFTQPIQFTHGTLMTPDKEPIVYFIKTRRIQPYVSAENTRLIGFIPRVIIFTLYSLVDAPALNHQHATPISPSSSSSNIPHAVSPHLYWRIIFVVSISILPSLSVRFHKSTQISVCSSKWYFKRVLMLVWLCG